MSTNKATKMSNDEKRWQEVIKNHPEANFLQSPEYGRMNEILKNKIIVRNFSGGGYALMIVRDARRGRYLEIPCGPLIDWNGNNKIDPSDIAISLAIAEEEEMSNEDEGDDEQD